MRWLLQMLATACLVSAPNALAQSNEPAPAAAEAAVTATQQDLSAPPAPTASAATTVIPAGTEIVLEFTEALSSRTTQTGHLFGLRLAQPIVIDGVEVAPAGAVGGGEVIDAHRSGMGGRQGVLNLSGRYLEIGGQRIRIRGMQVFSAGEDNTREAVNSTMLIGGAVGATIGLLIQGGEVEIPVGSRAQARIAAAVSVPTPEGQTPLPVSAADAGAAVTLPETNVDQAQGATQQ